MIREHQHKVCNALHQHLLILHGGGFLRGSSLCRQHGRRGQRRDEGQLPQHLFSCADLCKGFALGKAADAVCIEFFRNFRGHQLGVHLPLALCKDGFLQRARRFGSSKGGKVRMFQKSVQSRAHLGGGQSVLGEKGRAFQRGLLGLVHDAGHADLGGHRSQFCRRIPPCKALLQLSHQCRVCRDRLCRFRFLFRCFRLRLSFLHRDHDLAFRKHKGQFQISCQPPQRPAEGMHQQCCTQPVGKAARLLVQRFSRARSKECCRLGKGIAGLGHAQRHREDQLILCTGERHI